jgi:hypothetical protein
MSGLLVEEFFALGPGAKAVRLLRSSWPWSIASMKTGPPPGPWVDLEWVAAK